MKRFLVLVLMILVLTSCGSKDTSVKNQYAYTFRLAETHPDNHPTTLADYEFARLVEEKSEGRIQIIVYSNKQLGEEKDIIEQIQFGAIDFARVSTGPMSEFVPKLSVIQLPYLYEDGDHMWRVLESEIGDTILKDVEDSQFIGLAWMDAGARSFYNVKGPISNIEDLKGLKFRVMQNIMMSDMVEALGASSIAMPYGEVYSSLQTGAIDGAENNWPSYDTSSHYEVAPYFSLDEHIRVPEILLGSMVSLSHLSDADMLLIKEAAKETQDYQRKLWAKKEKESEEKLIEKGVIMNIIEDREVFREKMAPVYTTYASDYLEIIEEIRSMAK